MKWSKKSVLKILAYIFIRQSNFRWRVDAGQLALATWLSLYRFDKFAYMNFRQQNCFDEFASLHYLKTKTEKKQFYEFVPKSYRYYR